MKIFLLSDVFSSNSNVLLDKNTIFITMEEENVRRLFMKIQAVFFDIDGTFYDHNTNRVLTSTKQAVKELKERGYKVALCSGRPLRLAQELPVLKEFTWDGFIGGSGFDVYNEKFDILAENGFRKEQLMQIFSIAEQHGIPLYVNADHTYMSAPLVPGQEHVLQDFHLPLPAIHKWDGKPVDALSIFMPNKFDTHYLESVEDIRLQPSCDAILDIQKSDVNKASGIAQLMAYWKLEDGAYMAFGDSMNDCEMISHAAIGVAMGNAMEELKPYADYVCGNSDTPAIYETLKKFGLL